MKITVFASGSGGNCLLLCGGGTNILIDAGISLRRLSDALGQCCLSLQDIGGVLITHEHSDHISGLGSLIKKTDIPVYAPRRLAGRLSLMIPGAYERITEIPVGESFSISGLQIRAFHTPHDASESVGYHVEHGVSFALATDMGRVTDEIRAALHGCDTVLIEANHDVDMLLSGPYPPVLKRRILSERGHLSNADCAELARELAQSGTRQIILGHLSRKNNSPEAAHRTVAAALEGMDVSLYCAPESGCLEITMEEEPCLA